MKPSREATFEAHGPAHGTGYGTAGHHTPHDTGNDNDEWQCARQVVDILFDRTGLAKALAESSRVRPRVIVGRGNWISFSLDQAVGAAVLSALRGEDGKRWFASVPFTHVPFASSLFAHVPFTSVAFGRGQARSRTTPSLHLTNVDSGQPLIGHVDAYYWARNPWRHGLEFFLKRTAPPSALLKLCMA